ncbi:MAG: aldehyde dehydrogenase family protein [Thermoanaerobaculales bacterium]|jgi:acyl-CoA reductase-like NAD-dependent aldehyde dehydrogenase|nr:aldehyde dehydrogenase family protein [Thermoanaerobaculales bacterium]
MGSAIPVRNPRTGENDFFIEPYDRQDVEREAGHVRAHQPAWAADLDLRIATLEAWKDELVKARGEIAEALAVDTGRRALSYAEVDVIVGATERWCRQAPKLLQPPSPRPSEIPGIELSWTYSPYPVVAVISPWNFPLILTLIDAIPALAAGCAVIAKASKVTPRFVEPLADTIARVPELDRVFRMIRGVGRIGSVMIDYADAVAFTGSITVGRIVAHAAAERLIPAFLELGGKDAAIVTTDADIERAATALLRASVSNTGQACQSIERIYVQRPVFDEFVAKLVDKAKATQLNYPDIDSGQVGPLIAAEQADVIRDHVADAVAKGAVIHCGGEIESHGGGAWCRPTVLTNVSHEMECMREETFGPLMPAMPFDTIDEAVALANDSNCGLSGAVIAGSRDEAEAIGARIEAGGISIQDAGMTSFVHDAEKDSTGESGIGRSRMGASGLLRFLRHRALICNTGDPWPLEMFQEGSQKL